MIRFRDFQLAGASPVGERPVRVRHEVADGAVLRLEDEPTAPTVPPAVSDRGNPLSISLVNVTFLSPLFVTLARQAAVKTSIWQQSVM